MDATPTPRRPRRSDALTAAGIVRVAIRILDDQGEEALTFRALATALKTGPGGIYHHLSNKQELLAAAAVRLVGAAVVRPRSTDDAEASIRAMMLDLFDVIDAHPWIGAQLSQEPWQAALLEMFENIGRLLVALGVPERRQFVATTSLVNFVLGVAGQYAAAARLSRDVERGSLLQDVADDLRSDATAKSHPFAHRMAGQLAEHDDREQFAEGVDLLLIGIASTVET